MFKFFPVMVLMLLPLAAQAQLQTTVAPPSLPNLSATDQPTNDPNATYCRPPQRRTDSQLMGPRVCMTNKEWSDLHAAGFDIGPDGAKVSEEKHVNMLSH